MRSRVIFTKIWEDDWFQSLSDSGQKLFLYLITNENIGFSGIYQISEWKIKSQARIKNLEKVKTELNPKVIFYKDWVRVVNSERYNSFRGGKLQVALERELERIDEEVKNALFSNKEDRVSIGYQYPSDTSTITYTNIYNKIEDVKEEEFNEIANKYSVPLSFVKDKYDDMVNWHNEDVVKNKKKNWKATLMNWVKRDAKKLNIRVSKIEVPVLEKLSEEEKEKSMKKLAEIREKWRN